MCEDDIMHENGNYWVARDHKPYVHFTVYKAGTTHSVSDSAYTELSVATARCDYLARRAKERTITKP